jgi:threonine/homoserine/homoserine lactone efflux protein
MQLTAPPRRRTGGDDTDGMAVTSFALGLIGLVVLNVVLGPIAVVLSVRALSRGTERRSRAVLGLVLGIADLLLFAVLLVLDDAPLFAGM